ncbi:MAG: hypothetical protein HYZ27_01940 [Deltaproteobacteria bacterium]|nr:hypothetical protein [Deltaproteobacteria bacterium]
MAPPDSRVREESERDIAAARAELKGRRDQIVAEYDERLLQLDQLLQQLDSGALQPKAVSDRVRQLLGERGGARVARAGRTSIGMQLPTGAPPTPAPIRMGPTGPAVASAIAKVSAAVDARLALLLVSEATRDELRLELALAGRLHRSLERALAELPEDVVLLASLGEYAGEAQAILDDLAAGGLRRAERLIAFARDKVGELAASGGQVAELKAQLKRAKEKLVQGDATGGTADASVAWMRAHAELTRLEPASATSLLDDLVVRRV